MGSNNIFVAGGGKYHFRKEKGGQCYRSSLASARNTFGQIRTWDLKPDPAVLFGSGSELVFESESGSNQRYRWLHCQNCFQKVTSAQLMSNKQFIMFNCCFLHKNYWIFFPILLGLADPDPNPSETETF